MAPAPKSLEDKRHPAQHSRRLAEVRRDAEDFQKYGGHSEESRLGELRIAHGNLAYCMQPLEVAPGNVDYGPGRHRWFLTIHAVLPPWRIL